MSEWEIEREREKKKDDIEMPKRKSRNLKVY